MSWKIGLHIGRHFAEVSAQQNQVTFQRRWYLPKKALTEGLEEFFDQHSEVRQGQLVVTSRSATSALQSATDSPIALLVTSGFEDWPLLRQPMQENHLTLHPQRALPLVSRDLIFGLSERTAANGETLQAVEQQELEFLKAKLELAGVTQLAVGFLHSTVNPANELQTAQYFAQAGFTVLCSHQVSEESNEVGRWWRTVLNTFLTPQFYELSEQLQQIGEKYSLSFDLQSAGGQLFRNEAANYIECAFGHLYSLTQACHRPNPPLIVYLGLEDFFIVDPAKEQNIWPSSLGPIALKSPRWTPLTVQPTTVMTTDFWGIPDFSKSQSFFDPGPMFLGRSLKPTFLDLVFLSDQLTDIEGLSPLILAKTKKRILETFQTILKFMDRSGDNDPLDFAQSLKNVAVSLIAEELLLLNDTNRDLILAGPLASVFHSSLAKHLPEHSIELFNDQQLTLASSNIPRGNQ